MASSMLLKIPKDRVGVLIGPEGHVKETLEKKLKVSLEIDGKTGDVTITTSPENNDPISLFQAKAFVQAIGRGFSPENAFILLGADEDVILEVIELREIFGRSPSDIKRVKGRVIGKEGKMRQLIEELTETKLSVFGDTISLIGKLDNVQTAKEAVMMLIKGSQHVTVSRFLQRKRREQKLKMLDIWEKPS